MVHAGRRWTVEGDASMVWRNPNVAQCNDPEFQKRGLHLAKKRERGGGKKEVGFGVWYGVESEKKNTAYKA